MADLLDELMASPEAHPPVILDRSTIEAYAVCPWQGWCVEHGLVHTSGPEADAGQEAHEAIGQAVGQYAEDGGDVASLVEIIEAASLMSRPDVQPDVVEATKRSAWSIAQYVTSRHPLDILRYDGGSTEFANPRTGEVEDRSGQLAWDILPATSSRGPIRLTSEVDLLVAGAAVDELAETDWKSGRTVWSATDVAASFQFRMHAWLVLRNYPDAERVFVRVWMTRMPRATGFVRFDRSIVSEFEGQAMSALHWRDYAIRASETARESVGAEDLSAVWSDAKARSSYLDAACEASSDEPLTWPSVSGCGICPAWWCCPACVRPVCDLNADPAGYAADTHAMEQAVAERKKLLRTYVDESGEIDAGGVCFGLHEPKSPRKPSAAQYKFYSPPKE